MTSPFPSPKKNLIRPPGRAINYEGEQKSPGTLTHPAVITSYDSSHSAVYHEALCGINAFSVKSRLSLGKDSRWQFGAFRLILLFSILANMLNHLA